MNSIVHSFTVKDQTDKPIIWLFTNKHARVHKKAAADFS